MGLDMERHFLYIMILMNTLLCAFQIDYDEYTDSGFLALQRCIDQEFIDSVRDQTNHDIQVSFKNPKKKIIFFFRSLFADF